MFTYSIETVHPDQDKDFMFSEVTLNTPATPGGVIHWIQSGASSNLQKQVVLRIISINYRVWPDSQDDAPESILLVEVIR